MHVRDSIPATVEEAHIYNFPQREGNAGVMQTALLMRKLVAKFKTDPRIRGLALSLVQLCPEKDAVCEIGAVFQYVRDSIRYVMDIYDVETLHTPVQTIDIGQGDCDDKATLLAALLESIGYSTMFKLVAYNGSDFEHVYVYAAGHGVAMHLDPTEPEEAGWEAGGITRFVYVT